MEMRISSHVLSLFTKIMRMRNFLAITVATLVVAGGVVLGVHSAKTALAITWTELKCQYSNHPACKPPIKVNEGNKNQG